MIAEEAFVPFPRERRAIPRVTEVKTTWIAASLASLRKEGYYDRYLELLPKAHHEPILFAVAGTWLPVQLAIEHYRACEGLGLSRDVVTTRGEALSATIQASLLDVAARVAKGAGVTPWTIFEQYPRMWSRVFSGGAIGVFKLGPKEARVEVVGLPLGQFAYYRAGMRGVLLNIGARFCTKAYCVEIAGMREEALFAYRYSWA